MTSPDTGPPDTGPPGATPLGAGASTTAGGGSGPLAGLKVLELGQLIAGPWAGAILGFLGAEVVKVEPPTGDPLRTWRGLDGAGTSHWWRSIGRNKRSVVLDLRTPDGRGLVRRLAMRSDVLIENFRPGRMEEWGLGPEAFEEAHPELIYARVSGYGQTGPYRERPGYAAVAEAVGGLRYLTGHEGEPPVRPNLSLGDTLAALQAVIAILAALHARSAGRGGQVADVALYESVFSVLEGVVPEYGASESVRRASGTGLTGIAPSNLYPCTDGHVVIGANGESVFGRLAEAIGQPQMAQDPRLADNPGRVRRAAELDEVIAGWTKRRTVAEVVRALTEADVPCGPVNTVEDMVSDPQFAARGLLEAVDGYLLPAMQPRLDKTPGRTVSAGPELGAHTDEVLAELGVDADERRRLASSGVTAVYRRR